MRVELLDKMGTDLTAVNAARVSYNRTRQVFDPLTDVPLLGKLARDGHNSPYYHPHLSFRISAAIYVARQLHRHHVGLAMNEVSRRYTGRDLKFDWPFTRTSSPEIQEEFQNVQSYCLQTYEDLLEMGVPREQARSVLPLGLETTWIWTGSLFAFANMFRERTTPETQQETKEVVLIIGEVCRRQFPYAWGALIDGLN